MRNRAANRPARDTARQASRVRFRHAGHVRSCRRAAPGFTLLELAVTIGIIAILLSLLGPALKRTIGSARGFKCQMALRTIAFDFALFADPAMHGPRGDDAQFNNRFRISTFQESQYGIDEFWAHDGLESYTFTTGDDSDHMRCVEVRGSLTVNRDHPCTSAGALSPPQNVSYGFNSRLHRIEVQGPFGVTAQPVFLTPEILQHPDVPLAWDVDGAEAFAKNILTPQFSAPSLDSQFLYANDRMWYPAHRHNGAVNVAFVGGHVSASRDPLNEPAWQWGHEPR